VKTIGKHASQEQITAKVLRLIVSPELDTEDDLVSFLQGEKQEADKTVADFKSDLMGCIENLCINMRQTIATNMDLKFEYYTQQQTYQHMQVINSCSLHPIKTQEIELVKYFKLMIAKVLLHIRTGQSGYVYDIFVSLFDIVNDPGILGLSKSSLLAQRPIKWKKPELFNLKEDFILMWLKQGAFEEL
jgi:hypothetical protein